MRLPGKTTWPVGPNASNNIHSSRLGRKRKAGSVTLIELIERFPNDEACRQHLVSIRWPNGVECPRCHCERTSELPKRKQWTCLKCRYRFSATAGTIFHKSHIGLRKWFMAIFIVLNAKKGISSLELNRQLKISQECCWHLVHRIREAMREGDTPLFSGIVQADEYYHGGSPRKPNRRTPFGVDGRKTSPHMGRASSEKSPVLGAVESASGRVRTTVLDKVRSKEIRAILGSWIDKAKTELHTDQLAAYWMLGRECVAHRVVNHHLEYVAADGTHTNAIENAWSLFARAVMGSFHFVSEKHLHRYLDEFDARFNSRRDDSGEFFDRILRKADGRKLTLESLTA